MKLLLLSLILFLVSCGHTPEKVVVDNFIFVRVVCEDFGRIDPVEALPVVYVTGTDSDGNKVLGLRGDMYSNLAIVIRDTLRYIGEQNNSIDYYKQCIENHNSTTLNDEGEPG